MRQNVDPAANQTIVNSVLYSKWFGTWIVSPEVTWWVNLVFCTLCMMRVIAWVEKVTNAADRINSRH